MQKNLQLLPLEGNEGFALLVSDAAFSYSIYERALDLGIEADVKATGNGCYLVELFGEEVECDAALTLACAGEVLV